MEFIRARESDPTNADTCVVQHGLGGMYNGYWSQQSNVDNSMYIRILDYHLFSLYFVNVLQFIAMVFVICKPQRILSDIFSMTLAFCSNLSS